MRRSKKTILFLGIALSAVLAFTACASAPAAQVATPNAGTTAGPEQTATPSENTPQEPPEETNTVLGTFAAEDLEGEEVTQDIFADHNLTMLNIWATYCGPCLSEMPDLGALDRAYEEQGFQIVGVPVDVIQSDGSISEAQVDLAKEIVEKTGVGYTNLLPTEDLLMAGVASVSVVPTTIFIDRYGNQVGEAYFGSRSMAQWQEIVDELLKQAPKEAQEETVPVGNRLESGTEPASPSAAASVLNLPSFEQFETTDLDGNSVTETILEGDPAPELVLGLVWDPAWEGSGRALEKVEEYLADNDAMRAVGFVMSTDPESIEKAKEVAEQAGADFPQLLPTDALKAYSSGENPQVLMIAPWGAVGGVPFDPDLDLSEWSELTNDAMYTLYIGCCG